MTDPTPTPDDANPTTRYDPPAPPRRARPPRRHPAPARAARAAASPATWRPHRRRSRPLGSIVIGGILLAVGLWFFADQTLGLEMPRLRLGRPLAADHHRARRLDRADLAEPPGDDDAGPRATARSRTASRSPTGAAASRPCTPRSARWRPTTRRSRSPTGEPRASGSSASTRSRRCRPPTGRRSGPATSTTIRGSASWCPSSLPPRRPAAFAVRARRSVAPTRCRSAASAPSACPFPDGEQRLSVFWMAGYAGGLFIPFRDATNGRETYGGRALPGRCRQVARPRRRRGDRRADPRLQLRDPAVVRVRSAMDVPARPTGEPPRHRDPRRRASDLRSSRSNQGTEAPRTPESASSATRHVDDAIARRRRWRRRRQPLRAAYHRSMTETTADPVLSTRVREFVAATRFTSIATLDPDGAPRQAVVWYRLDGDEIVLNSAVGRRWPANLIRDRRVSLAVLGRRGLPLDRADAARDARSRDQADRPGRHRRDGPSLPRRRPGQGRAAHREPISSARNASASASASMASTTTWTTDRCADPMPVRFGLQLWSQQTDWPSFRDAALAAEAERLGLGLDVGSPARHLRAVGAADLRGLDRARRPRPDHARASGSA